MEVKLLKELINDAINTQNETKRIEAFWVFAPDYDKCFPVFKEIFFNKKMNEIKNKECKIKRHEKGFCIEDSYGNHDFFTDNEVLMFIKLWEKAQDIKPNIIELK